MNGELQAVQEAIRRLIIKRRETPRDEQQPINDKLTKLYDVKYLIMQREV